MKIDALIPARSGSKRIPNKNMQPLGGKPLLYWTIQAALENQYIDNVYVSTDSTDIQSYAIQCGAEAPFLRPDELADDTALSIDAVLHALDWLHKNKGDEPDAIALLQPTSPIRNCRHLTEAIKIFIKNKNHQTPTSVVSVQRVPHNMTPEKIMTLDPISQELHYLGGKDLIEISPKRSQEAPTYYARNGAAIYITWTETIRNLKSVFDKRTVAYTMNREDSIDIDDISDLKYAQFRLSEMFTEL